jgi:hypothetical protein
MKKITAKFNSVCAETGKKLKKGDAIYYDISTRKAYHITASIINEQSNNDSAYISAQEDAYWNNVTGGYYSR